MLSRRDALLATAAICVGMDRSQKTLGCLPDPTADTKSVAAHSQLAAVAACRKAAKECSSLESSHAAQGFNSQFRTLCRESRDICSVTARVLSRRNSTASALCQACADACDRMVLACQSGHSDRDISRCKTAVENCAALCRALISHSYAA